MVELGSLRILRCTVHGWHRDLGTRALASSDKVGSGLIAVEWAPNESYADTGRARANNGRFGFGREDPSKPGLTDTFPTYFVPMKPNLPLVRAKNIGDFFVF